MIDACKNRTPDKQDMVANLKNPNLRIQLKVLLEQCWNNPINLKRACYTKSKLPGTPKMTIFFPRRKSSISTGLGLSLVAWGPWDNWL